MLRLVKCKEVDRRAGGSESSRGEDSLSGKWV